MNRVKAFTSEIIRLTDRYLRLEIRIEARFVPLEMDRIEQFVSIEDEVFQSPAFLVEHSKVNSRYRLFLDLEKMEIQERVRFMDGLRSDFFYLEPSLKPIYQLKANAQKILMVIDHEAILESLALSSYLFEQGFKREIGIMAQHIDSRLKRYLDEGLSTPINILTVDEPERVQQFLANQCIGTNLFIAGHWEFVKEVLRFAAGAGYTPSEIQLSGYGLKYEKVFCVKCCALTIKPKANQLACQNCRTLLEVSDRYSKRLDAYLGYIYGGVRKGSLHAETR